MERYVVEKIKVPKIYAQKTFGYDEKGVRKYKDIGEPLGPFLTSIETGRQIGMRNSNIVANFLNKMLANEGWRFFTRGEKEIVFNVPNVQRAKEHHLLIIGSRKCPHTVETILYNMKQCGFENVDIVKFDGKKSILRVDCCNVACDKKVDLSYNRLTHKKFDGARCDECKRILKSYSALHRVK